MVLRLLFIYFQFWDGVQNSNPKGVAGCQFQYMYFYLE